MPRFSSILSAYGIACADLTAEASAPFAFSVPDDFARSALLTDIQRRVSELTDNVDLQLVAQGVDRSIIEHTTYISTHYEGSDTVLQIPFGSDLRSDFVAAHLRETSFSMGRGVQISNIRVFGVGRSMSVASADFALALKEAEASNTVAPDPQSWSDAHFEIAGSIEAINTPVYALSKVPIGASIDGPAIIVDSTQTIVVEPNTKATCLEEHVILRLNQLPGGSVKDAHVSSDLVVDPIELAVFANRFMSIAEQMGHTLQRTSVSVSIKERLDFSCSIHGTDGALVANAPHIPVHLGSMQYAVQAQHQHWLGRLKPGDVLLTNHPEWGGEMFEMLSIGAFADVQARISLT